MPAKPTHADPAIANKTNSGEAVFKKNHVKVSEENLLGRGLPKWPQMIVTGMPVIVDQAKEIIRRTDTFFSSGYGGNNKKYEATIRELVGMPVDPYTLLKYTGSEDEKAMAEHAAKLAMSEYYEKLRTWRLSWECIETEYVNNTWASSCFIGGPHGWCHPDGQIGYLDNVGKYPSIEAIQKDWETIVSSFPFLDIGVTLMDGESCEDDTRPVVSLRILNGKVTLHDPLTTDVHASHEAPVRRADAEPNVFDEFMKSYGSGDREQGLPAQWFVDWARQRNPTSVTLSLLDLYDKTPRLPRAAP